MTNFQSAIRKSISPFANFISAFRKPLSAQRNSYSPSTPPISSFRKSNPRIKKTHPAAPYPPPARNTGLRKEFFSATQPNSVFFLARLRVLNFSPTRPFSVLIRPTGTFSQGRGEAEELLLERGEVWRVIKRVVKE